MDTLKLAEDLERAGQLSPEQSRAIVKVVVVETQRKDQEEWLTLVEKRLQRWEEQRERSSKHQEAMGEHKITMEKSDLNSRFFPIYFGGGLILFLVFINLLASPGLREFRGMTAKLDTLIAQRAPTP